MSFDRAYDLLIENEGGYSNHPADNGGETRFGISKARYPNEDIKNLTRERAKFLTKRDFWDTYRLGELPWAIATTMLDCVFQHNPKNPITWLQRAIGATADGILGSKTIAAANQLEDPVQVARDILLQRLDYYMSLADWPTFKNGWKRRCFDVMIGAAHE